MYPSKKKFIDYKDPLTIETRHGKFTIYVGSKADQPKRLWCPFCGTELDLANLPEPGPIEKDITKHFDAFLKSQEKMIEMETKNTPASIKPVFKKYRKTSSPRIAKKRPKRAQYHPPRSL